MPKCASLGYKKMSKFNLIFGHLKNHPNFSNFFDSKNVHNYTGQEFDNELRFKLNNFFEERLISAAVPLRQTFQASKRGGRQRIAENIFERSLHSFFASLQK